MKYLIFSMLLVLAADSVHAQLPDSPYIGLFTSGDRSTHCATGPAQFYEVEMWIWCLPNIEGQVCAEFAIQYPPNVFPAVDVTANDAIISVTLGNLENGMSVCYKNCHWDWTWPFRQQLFVLDWEPSWVEIVPHPDAGAVQFADCT